jgi:hypothetical protein
MIRESRYAGHLFTLSPVPFGVVSLSVALSFPLPGLRVMEHLALRSSDFPPRPEFAPGVHNQVRNAEPVLLHLTCLFTAR